MVDPRTAAAPDPHESPPRRDGSGSDAAQHAPYLAPLSFALGVVASSAFTALILEAVGVSNVQQATGFHLIVLAALTAFVCGSLGAILALAALFMRTRRHRLATAGLFLGGFPALLLLVLFLLGPVFRY